MTIHIEVTHVLRDERQGSVQAQILAIVQSLLSQGKQMSTEIVDLTKAVTDVVDAVKPLPAAIDKLEAAVTAATGLSPADKTAIADAIAALKGVKTNVDAAVADAGDGVDEAAPVPVKPV